nr:hypothetical protein [Rhodococcus globerulus]
MNEHRTKLLDAENPHGTEGALDERGVGELRTCEVRVVERAPIEHGIGHGT